MEKNKLILIAESLPDIQKLFEAALEKDGFKVIATDDGDRALEIITFQPVDLLILDMEIQGKGGYEIIKFLQSYEHRNVPVIAVSGKYMQDDLVKFLSLEQNVKKCFIKPPNMPLMMLNINDILGTKPAPLPDTVKRERIPSIDSHDEEESEALFPSISIHNDQLRKISRVKCDIVVQVFEPESDTAQGSGRLLDFSLGGLCLFFTEELPVDHEVGIYLDQDDVALKLYGLIVYKKKSRGGYRYGIQLMRIPPEEKERVVAELMKLVPVTEEEGK